MTEPNARHADENFTQARAAAVVAGLQFFDHVGETGSTNADLVARAASGAVEPGLRVADHQTAGRGRLDRRWDDIRGGQLLVSFLFPIGEDPPQQRASAVAAAARAGLEGLGVPVRFKWPNDLLLVEGPAPGKVAGLLSEFVNQNGPAVVVGLGLNVEPVPVEGATSLAEAGCATTRDQVLRSLLEHLPERIADPQLVRQELVAYSATIGQQVRVELPDRTLVGRAQGLDHDGALVIDDGVQQHHVGVGDVIHLRSAQHPGAT